jgi:hypothetical protein
MKASKLLLGFSLTLTLCAIAFLSQSTGPLLANGTAAPSSFQTNVISPSAKDAQSAPKNRSTPLTKIAACLPGGASCNSNADCCSQSCLPMHHSCANR